MWKFAAFLLVLALGGQATAQELELKFATWFGRAHRMDKFIIAEMENQFNERFAGAAKIVVYDSNSLIAGPFAQYPKVVEGEADFTLALPGYTPKLFPRTLMFELPGIYDDPVLATRDIWDNMDEIEKDFADVKIIALWANDPTVLITRDKPVTNIADIRGMKVRVSSPAHARIIRSWGGIPVNISTPASYAALAEREIDAIFVAGTAVQGFKFYEPGNFITSNLPPSVGTMYVVMGRKQYEALPPEQREFIDNFSGRELSMQAAAIYKRDGPGAIDIARDNGVQIIELTPFQVQSFEARFPYSQIETGN